MRLGPHFCSPLFLRFNAAQLAEKILPPFALGFNIALREGRFKADKSKNESRSISLLNNVVEELALHLAIFHVVSEVVATVLIAEANREATIGGQ